jgi:hypothetical protein
MGHLSEDPPKNAVSGPPAGIRTARTNQPRGFLPSKPTNRVEVSKPIHSAVPRKARMLSAASLPSTCLLVAERSDLELALEAQQGRTTNSSLKVQRRSSTSRGC